jgi:hypothetical protein
MIGRTQRRRRIDPMPAQIITAPSETYSSSPIQIA